MIIQLTDPDLPRAAEVIRASFATVAAEFGLTRENCPRHTSFATTTERLCDHLGRGWLLYGFFESGRLVGYVSISKSKETDGAYELHNLAVLPEHRHKGYGRQLLDFCKDRVREAGGMKLVLGIIEENAVLKDWYIKNGFVHIGTKKFEQFPFTSGYMEYNLGAT